MTGPENGGRPLAEAPPKNTSNDTPNLTAPFAPSQDFVLWDEERSLADAAPAAPPSEANREGDEDNEDDDGLDAAGVPAVPPPQPPRPGRRVSARPEPEHAEASGRLVRDLVDGIPSALAAAGYGAGERFEVASILERPDGKKEIESSLFANDEVGVAAAVAWAAERDGRKNLYLGSNPIRRGAVTSPRPGDVDVSPVRVLLIDADPLKASDAPQGTKPEGRAAASAIVAAILAFLLEHLGVRPARIDSGRGQQVWLRHEPFLPETKLDNEGQARVDDPRQDRRRRFVHALADRFDVDNAHVDRATHNLSRLMRLPGAVNLRTGERAFVFDPGDGKEVSLEALERLTLELEAEIQGTAEDATSKSDFAAEGSERPGGEPGAVERLCALLRTVPAKPEAWRWIGALAAKRGVADLVREHVADDQARRGFDEGVAAFGKGDRLARPFDEALAKRLDRALVGLSRPPASAPTTGVGGIRIESIVRRTAGEGRGATLDLTIVTPRGRATLQGFDGAGVLAYNRVAARAVEEGVVLPYFGKKGNELWRDAVAAAFATVLRVEAPAPEEDLSDALEAALLRFLREAPRAETPADLESGSVLLEGERLLVKPSLVVAAVRRALPDDSVSRRDVAQAARRLGLEGARPRLEGLGQPRLWAVPARLLNDGNDGAGERAAEAGTPAAGGQS